MPKKALEYARFSFQFPVITRLWPYLVGLAWYTAAVVAAEGELPVPNGGNLAKPPGFGDVALTGILFGWLMSFRTTASYSRWWEGRTLWGKLVNDSRNIHLKATRFLSPAAAGQVSRLVVEFAGALRDHLRVPPPKPGVPPPPPAKHVPLDLAGQVYDVLRDEFAAGRVDGRVLQMLDVHALALMDVAGACERIKFTPLAASYRGLLRKGIAAYMLVLPWLSAPNLGWYAVPVVVLVGYALIGLELIAEDIENPFGRDGDDLKLDDIVATIRRSLSGV